MTIARIKKLTLIGDAAAQREVLEHFQVYGKAHLISVDKSDAKVSHAVTSEIKEALAYLLASPQKRRSQIPLEDFSPKEVVADIIANKVAREEAFDEIELLRAHYRAHKRWGDFEYPPLEALDGYRLWFYYVPLSKEKALNELALPWKVINRDHKCLYLSVVSKSEPNDTEVPFKRAHIGPDSLSGVKKKREALLVRLEELNAQREALTRWILPLTMSINDSVDQQTLARAEQCVQDFGDVFVLNAWLPESEAAPIEAWARDLNVAFQLNDPSDTEEPPTLLQNNSVYGGGEETVSFFQLPGYRTWDPSIMIFFSFSLFFSVILADAGYAVIIALLLAPFWKRLGRRSETALRLRNLCFVLAVSATVYGVMIGSYFGIELHEDHVLSSLQVLDVQDFSSMMKFSIGVGVLHLMMANVMVAWTNRTSRIALAALGWMSVTGASFNLWLDYISVPDLVVTSTWSFRLIMLGILFILLFSGQRKLTEPKDYLFQFFDGAAALYGLSKIFGDVLSYMRLFALGLSSVALAITFNNLAVQARDSVSAGGFILFALILVLGHGLNFVLGVMSGVIHGLRLNLLEFYNWGVKGEGYPFKPFKKRGD